MAEPYDTMSLRVAETIAAQLKEKPASALGMPTGRTPEGCYRILSQWSRQGRVDWSKAKCFGLDDYFDVDQEQSFRHYLDNHLYNATNLPQASRFNPLDYDNYDALIAGAGGLDMAIVGIGGNGHIAFNEPGTPRLSWTHCMWLAESTRAATASTFGSIERVPEKAVTIGIETIMQSRCVVLIASGAHKHDILARALNGPVSLDLPASVLTEHGNLKVITDFA